LLTAVLCNLFRAESSKIAKHWDAAETIPPSEVWKNQNAKF